MPVDVTAEVIANRPLSTAYNVVTLAAPAIAAASAPGQFVMVKPGAAFDPLLRRPFSVFEIVRDSQGTATAITLLSKRIGKNCMSMGPAAESGIGPAPAPPPFER